MNKQQWDLTSAPSLAGKIALVTGGNRGLGLEITAALASLGAHVVMACRDTGRAEQAVAAVQERVPTARLAVVRLDLADLASVRSCAAELVQAYPRLDILVNNASAILVPKGSTRDGFEVHIGTNHLGHFALTGLLLPSLSAAPAARVVNTSSLAHRMTKGLDFADLHFQQRAYKDMDAYGASKLAALLFTFELERRLQAANLPIKSLAAHPGYTATNTDLGGFFMRLSTRLFAQSVSMGALPALYAATAEGVNGGDYIGPGGFKELKGNPQRVGCRPEARDLALARRLWQVSEELTGVSYL